MDRAYRGQNTEHETRDLGGVVERSERVSHESEERRGTQSRDVGEQQEGKVESRIGFESSHEVDDNCKDDLG